MIVNNDIFFNQDTAVEIRNQRGSIIIEVLLAFAIIIAVSPFVYRQVANSNMKIRDVNISRDIIKLRGPVLNFLRANQDKWPEFAQIQLSKEELESISPLPIYGFIDKYSVRGATISDTYLVFDLGVNELESMHIARYIGTDATVVSADGVAYGENWAMTAPDLHQGNLVYRVSRDFTGADTSKYLHRGTSGEDDLNIMQRDLNMNGNNIYNIDSLNGDMLKTSQTKATFIKADLLDANSIYFSSGATMDGSDVTVDTLRVNGDVIGFYDILTPTLNSDNYTTNASILTDKAIVNKNVKVGHSLNIKSSSSTSISGFTVMTTNVVKAPYISATEILFNAGYGITVSGELLLTSVSPLQIGGWAFPKKQAPSFNSFILTRAQIPTVPENADFDKIISSDWKNVSSIQ